MKGYYVKLMKLKSKCKNILKNQILQKKNMKQLKMLILSFKTILKNYKKIQMKNRKSQNP